VSVKHNQEIICDEGMNASEWKNISFIIGDRVEYIFVNKWMWLLYWRFIRYSFIISYYLLHLSW